MPDTRTVTITAAITAGLWTVAALLLLSALALAIFDQWHAGVMFAFCSCIATGVAVTMSIKCSLCRTERLIRALLPTLAADPERDRLSLHPIR